MGCRLQLLLFLPFHFRSLYPRYRFGICFQLRASELSSLSETARVKKLVNGGDSEFAYLRGLEARYNMMAVCREGG